MKIANGNLLSQSGAGKTLAYTYDVYNRLIQYAEGSVKETYTYDAEGVRRSKVNGNDTICYISDTAGSLSYTLAETDKSGNVIATYNRADVLISQVREDVTSYYLFDGHGDVRALNNIEGRITDKYRYNAYDELVERSGETENHYLYTGEYYDGTSNLYYLRARYMNPSTGTFISMDTYEGSIYDPDTLHKYLYANGNPVKYSDPSGMFSISEAQIASGMQAVLNAMPRILYSGAISGLTSCIATALTGGTFKESMISLATGFAVGSGLMVVQYFCIAAEITSVAKMLLLTVGTIDTCFSLLVAIRSIAEESPMQVIQYSIMAILGVASIHMTWKMDFSALVIGDDGAITVSNKGDDNNSLNINNEGTIWSGKDKYVPELANDIEQKFPGKIKAVEKLLYNEDGALITDLDIELDNLVIQVKSGSAKGLTRQMITTANSTGKTVISYTPDISQSSAVLKGVRANGFETFTTVDELLMFLDDFYN